MKGDFNQAVCKEALGDILKFEQRNEQIAGQQEKGLKTEQAAAMEQEKMMMMQMQMKTSEMQKQKQKQQKEKQQQNKSIEKQTNQNISTQKHTDKKDTETGLHPISSFKTRLENADAQKHSHANYQSLSKGNRKVLPRYTYKEERRIC